MKGIAGVVYPDVFQMNDLVLPMLDTLKHRSGNGEQDVHTYKNIEIGVQGGKLAINEQRSIYAGIDGFISNHEDLRGELIQRGFQFKGKDIQELIVHGYEHWDTLLFDRLAGEFALVILDQRKKKLLLCRDRIGIKPLYWFHNSHYFMFASELKALLATGFVPQSPAPDALSSYLYFGYIPQDMTPISDVSKLLPAHYLQFTFDGCKSIVSYWSYSSYFERQNRNPLPVIIEELDQLIRQSVQNSVPKSGKVGCFLSGGLGSASIAKYASEVVVPKEALTAYTVVFSREDEEDLIAAKNVVEQLGITHRMHSITPENIFQNLVKIVWHIDEPLADPHIVSTWEMASLASEHTKTVLSGIGSDELFASHSRYSLAEQKTSYLKWSGQWILHALRKALIPLFYAFYKPATYVLVKQSRTNPLQYEYLEHNAFMNEKEIYAASPRLGGIFDPKVFLHKFHHLQRVHSTVASYLYFDVKTRLPDNYLMQYERITAAHSLSWRVPFLDRRIVEYVAELPEPEFLKESETGSYLKAILKDVFPESFVYRPKRTRREFLRKWLVTDEAKRVFSLLLKGTLVETGIISRRWLQNKLENLKQENQAFAHLWAILLLEIWFKLFINRPIEPFSPDIPLEPFLMEPF